VRERHQAFAEGVRAARRLSPEGRERVLPVWEPLVAAILFHIAWEEEHLLPRVERFAEGMAANQRPAVIRRDHALLRELLGALPEEPVARALHLGRLADVLEHHDRREAAGMLAVLADLPDGPAALAELATAESARAIPPEGALRRLVRRQRLPEGLDGVLLAAATDQDPPLEALAIPDHPRGPRLHALLVEAARRAETSDLPTRRDALAEVVDRARRIGLLRAPGSGRRSPG
jgi:hypothetical protein